MEYMIRYNATLFFLSILLTACQNEFTKTDSGLEYKFVHHGNGKVPGNGEYLILDLLVKTGTDSIIYSSADAGILFPVHYDTYRLKVGQKSQLEEGLFMMHEGDSAIFSVKTSDVYAALNEIPPQNMNDRIFCYARLVDVMNYAQYTQWKSEQITLRQSESDALMKKVMEQEVQKIDSTLKEHHQPFAVTGSGIRYIIEKQGTGSYPQTGDSVFFKYNVTYLDGTAPPDEFGRSGDKPKSFIMGSKQVFESWQESISLLKKGGTGKFYIPSPLAFGATQTAGVRPNAILIVSIQLVDIRNS